MLEPLRVVSSIDQQELAACVFDIDNVEVDSLCRRSVDG